ncbi:EAL domain-containing protein [Vibrio profundi]|uniref:EAL domain-containing protein n=1 Tax=Vibrio profundi TaxID=1774960 RepID=UPI0037360113
MAPITRAEFEAHLKQLPSGEWLALLGEYQFYSVFQPIFTQELGLYGFEALLRVKDKKGNWIRPDLFLSNQAFDEDTRLTAEMLSRVIHLRNFAQFYSGTDIHIFLNVIPSALVSYNRYVDSIANDQTHQLLRTRLKELNISIDRVVLEIVEQDCHETEELTRLIAKIKTRGYQLAIDDFGIGSSNHSRVKLAEPDIIKIDRSLLVNFAEGHSEPMLNAIDIARTNNALVLIEGIETSEQMASLTSLPIAFYQGYHLGKPEPLGYWAERHPR